MPLNAGTYKGRVGGQAYGFDTPDLAGLGRTHRYQAVGRATLSSVAGPIWSHSTDEISDELARRRMMGLGTVPRQMTTLGETDVPKSSVVGYVALWGIHSMFFLLNPVVLGASAAAGGAAYYFAKRSKRGRKKRFLYAGLAAAVVPGMLSAVALATGKDVAS